MVFAISPIRLPEFSQHFSHFLFCPRNKFFSHFATTMPSYGLLADLDVLKKAVPVKFVGGKYKKKSGWIDPTRPSNGITVPVIVKSAEKGGLYQTYVEVDNYRELNTDKPMTFHEYVFLVPDVEAKVVDTCHTIAKFDISKDDKG